MMTYLKYNDLLGSDTEVPKFPMYLGDVILSIPAQMSICGFHCTASAD